MQTIKIMKVTQSCPTLCDPIDSPGNSPGQNTEVGSCSLLQGIFPTQGLNRGLLRCRRILYQLSHQRSKKGHNSQPAKTRKRILSILHSARNENLLHGEKCAAMNCAPLRSALLVLETKLESPRAQTNHSTFL